MIAGRPSLSAVSLGSLAWPAAPAVPSPLARLGARVAEGGLLVWLSALLVSLPVFLQAPWVRLAPISALLFTVPLLAAGISLGCAAPRRWQPLGVLLVGFSGSWLAGSIFWGWCRMHPLWHLPIEALALPLALAGLGSRWRLAGAFYLGSLAGTACTDAVMALSGIMPLWPEVLTANPADAALLLQQAAQQVFTPLPLLTVLLSAWGMLSFSRWLWRQDSALRLAGTALATTLLVDGLFLLLALVAPGLSGLI